MPKRPKANNMLKSKHPGTLKLCVFITSFFYFGVGCSNQPNRSMEEGSVERQSTESAEKFIQLGSRTQFFISLDGSDDNEGSIEAPFFSLERARDALRALPQDERKEARIVLRGGRYERTTSFILERQDSGTKEFPVIYMAYPGERVVISGGPAVRLGEFSAVKDPEIIRRLVPEAAQSILQLNLKERGIEDFGELPLYGHSMHFLEEMTEFRTGAKASEVFFEEEPMTLARWPNDDFARVGRVVEKGDIIRAWMPDARGGRAMAHDYVPEEERNDPPLGFAFEFDRDRLERWTEASDLRLYGYWFYNWSDQSVQVASIDIEEGVISSVQPSAYSVQAGQRFFAYNLLEELDRPGEWYLDREKGILYLYPPRMDPEAWVYLSLQLEPLVVVNQARHVVFQGLEFGYSRGEGIIVNGGSNVQIIECRIGNLAEFAVHLNGGSNHRVARSEVFNTGGTGIRADGGSVRELTPANHEIADNWIYNFARIEKTYRPGISLSGVGNIARNNEIHHAPHVAIGFSGNNHLIERNHIHDVARETDDMAAIYAGRSWTARGTVIRHNLIRNVTGYQSGTHRVSGIYLDDGISGTTIEGNIFINVAQGLMLNGGRNNQSISNLFIDVENMMRSTNMRNAFQTWASMSWRTLNEGLAKAPIESPAWREQFPELLTLLDEEPDLPKLNIIQNNLRYNTPIIFGERGIHDAVVEFGQVENNVETEVRPGNFNESTGRVELNSANEGLEQFPGLITIPLDKIGRTW